MLPFGIIPAAAFFIQYPTGNDFYQQPKGVACSFVVALGALQRESAGRLFSKKERPISQKSTARLSHLRVELFFCFFYNAPLDRLYLFGCERPLVRAVDNAVGVAYFLRAELLRIFILIKKRNFLH